AQIETSAPSAAKPSAIARPMPLLPPVTSARLPLSPRSMPFSLSPLFGRSEPVLDGVWELGTTRLNAPRSEALPATRLTFAVRHPPLVSRRFYLINSVQSPATQRHGSRVPGARQETR